MIRSLHIHKIGPSVTVQDQGRPGYLDRGLSRSGAADILAIAEGAALLGQSPQLAALEMAGFGGEFSADADIRIGLTGAPMRATIDGAPIQWNASHLLLAGARLTVGAATAGVYGYLHVGGGIDVPLVLGSRSTHLAAALGAVLQSGEDLPIGPDTGTRTGMTLPADGRFSGGTARVLPSLQTSFFAASERDRFVTTRFHRDHRANRMGVRLIPEGGGFAPEGALNILSEIIVPGDIQVTGDGSPFVLLPEAQTTGGYPRIGTVLPCDLPMLAQATPGAEITFTFITLELALEAHRAYVRTLAGLPSRASALYRDPRAIADLLTYQLISGAVAGDEDF